MIDKYQQAFQEEARELLVELETALLELDQRPNDREVVGRAFRALHTIKGSGAMFGFDDIAGFAHDLETAFDRLRNGQLSATADLINLTLAAGDQMKGMLDEAAGRGAVDRGRSAGILSELRRLTGTRENGTVQATGTTPVLGVPRGSTQEWRIDFRPGPQLLLNGNNPLFVLRELRGLGPLRVTVDLSRVPPLAQMNPEICYPAWSLTLTTTAEPESIRDIFIFVEDDCELTIQHVPGQVAGTVAANGSGDQPKPVEGKAGSGAGKSSIIRVSTEKLDRLVNLVGELVTVQARLGEVAGRLDDPDILDISEEVDRLTTALRENSMNIRMMPLKATFERFRRLVHDLAKDLHKEVDLILEGAETELDKTVIDQLNDPLVHLIRNSMDHGIEPPEARRAAGKSPAGTIRLSALHSGAHVLIRLSDDGRGLDLDRVRSRAVELGLIDSAARLSEAEIFSLILAPGFSTAAQVTGLSGRGVGMDVVRRSLDELRGSIEISSRPGEGMTVTLRLPLTLAIIDGLLVRVDDRHFVLPLANSLECVELTAQEIENAHGNHLANVRGELIPYIRLREYFQMDTARPAREQIMVVETDNGQYGFVVDEVLGDHQTVIKNLGRLYRNVQMVSGATILGNGTVALILDPHRLVQDAVHSRWSGSRCEGSRALQTSGLERQEQTSIQASLAFKPL